MACFPMFIELQNRPCLVAGGGSVALRKVRVLQDFGALITVVSPGIKRDILSMGGVRCIERAFVPEDLEGMALVVAATGDPGENHRISVLCRGRGVPVNAVDQREDCDFIFPSYIKRGEVVAAFCSGGQSPVLTQYLKRENEGIVTEELGELAEWLGSIREEVKIQVPERLRKGFYEQIVELWRREGRIPTEYEMGEMLK